MDLFGDIEHPSLKKCTSCKDVKSISEFGKERRRTNGVNSQCKSCVSKRKRNRVESVVCEFNNNPPPEVKCKTCTKCSVEKSGNDFSVLKSSRDGLQSWCKTCVSNTRKENYVTKGRCKYDYSGFNDGMTMRDFVDSVGCGRHAARNYIKSTGGFTINERTKLFNERVDRYKKYAADGLTVCDVSKIEGKTSKIVAVFCYKNKITLSGMRVNKRGG